MIKIKEKYLQLSKIYEKDKTYLNVYQKEKNKYNILAKIVNDGEEIILSFYKNNDDSYTLTDNGYAYDQLEVNTNKYQSYSKVIQKIASMYDIDFEEGKLKTTFPKSNTQYTARKYFDLLTVVKIVKDLYMYDIENK